MYFKRLEMHGFKSFAEPAVIEFHEGVTCIVGPNGSGKSNISDAIRWVLGEQSPKMLRGGKMEEVIFAGTASRKSRGMAEVTLVIDNTAGILPIDYNEVAITRRMYRSGESEYLINNNQCRLKDIRELIMDTGIGVEGYSIIGQGRIADIVSSKPESRREIFEEAAGVVMYKSKKAESERKLSSASANLERVNDIIGEIESRIGGLMEDSQKAQEYLKLRDRSRELEINITLRSVEKLESSSNDARQDIDDVSGKIGELSAKKAQIDSSVNSNRQKADDLDKLGSQARDKLLQTVEEISDLTGKSRVDNERLGALAKDLQRTEEEIEAFKERKLREDHSASELRERDKEAAIKLNRTELLLQEKITAAAQINAEVSQLTERIDENRNSMYTLYNRSAAKRSEARSMESYKASLEQRREQIAGEQARFEQAKADSTADIQRLSEEKAACDKSAEELAGQLHKLRAERQKTEEGIRENERQISHLSIQESRDTARMKTIEEMENNYEGYSGAVRFIMKRGMKGIKGVTADLMTVPSGLETAIETAMGASIQNIVCEKDDDAKAAIRALKENKAGRLTFLPVESIKAARASLPENVRNAEGMKGLACDLIKFDKRYGDIFTYLLGRVAVVGTMDDAVSLSKKTGSGVRFVTLEGEVVNASGAMTGGRYKNNTANLLERKKEINMLASRIEDLKAHAAEAEKRLKDHKADLEQLIHSIKEKEAAADDLKMTASQLAVKIQAAGAAARETEDSAQKQREQLVNIEKDLEKASAMEKQLYDEADLCDKEAEEAKAEAGRLMEAYEKTKAEADKAAEEITAARIEKNRQDSERDNILSLLRRVEDSIKELDIQIGEKENLLEAYVNERNDITSGSAGLEDKVTAKSKERDELTEYISRVTEEKSAISAANEKLEAEQEELRRQLNDYQDQKYRQEIRLAKNETQLDTLKERLWEDFEITYLQALEMRKEDFVMSSAQKESREIRERIKELGDVNVGAIKEYAQVSERYQFLTEQRKDITEAMDQLQVIVDDMEKTIKTKFKSNFDQVVINFEAIFKQLFGGGHAELRLDNEEDPLSSGIEIIAQPPGKKLQNINLMSGGEKTMTAIALMFAVLKTRPTPFCILDEVEAALDDNNIDRFGKYLRNFKDIQFAIVTHQKATMEHADVLYGVTMPEQGISKVISLRMGDDFEL